MYPSERFEGNSLILNRDLFSALDFRQASSIRYGAVQLFVASHDADGRRARQPAQD